MDENRALEIAIETARKSPCMKSKRGVVLWNPRGGTWTAYNSPPKPFKCEETDRCRRICGKVAVHAEARVLLQSHHTPDMQMLHVKVVDGEAVPSGPPSCWQCSRLIVESGIRGVWLLHEDGLRFYTSVEFHDLTLGTISSVGAWREDND